MSRRATAKLVAKGKIRFRLFESCHAYIFRIIAISFPKAYAHLNKGFLGQREQRRMDEIHEKCTRTKRIHFVRYYL